MLTYTYIHIHPHTLHASTHADKHIYISMQYSCSLCISTDRQINAYIKVDMNIQSGIHRYLKYRNIISNLFNKKEIQAS